MDVIEPETEPGEQSGSLPPGAALQTVCLCMLFGANAVAVKISLAGLGIFTTAGFRFSVAALVIFLYARLTGRPVALNRSQFFRLAPLGLIFFVQLSLFYTGLSKTTASHGTLIANALPFVVMVLAHFFLPDDTISLRKIGGLVCGFLGVIVLLSDSLDLSGEALLGDLIVLAAIMVWGCNAIYAKRIIWDFHPVQITMYPMMMASPLFILGGIFIDPQSVYFIDPAIIGSLFYQTFVTASFGMVVWSSMIKRYGATALHSFIFIMPLSGVFFGTVLLDEPLTIHLLGAIILVTTGLIVVNRKKRISQDADF